MDFPRCCAMSQEERRENAREKVEERPMELQVVFSIYLTCELVKREHFIAPVPGHQLGW
jgi:hypothetical protein